MITIRETKEKDLKDILLLWNNGEVMRYVGFPQGLGYDDVHMASWFRTLQEKNTAKHYTIRGSNEQFVGETYWGLRTKDGLAAVDIKIMPDAQGRSYGRIALAYAIDQAFLDPRVSAVYVDPHKENERAIRMYRRLGFKDAIRPSKLDPFETFMIIHSSTWKEKRR